MNPFITEIRKLGRLKGSQKLILKGSNLAFKSSKLNIVVKKQLAQLKAQLKNDQDRNSINLKYSQNTQNDFSIKVL
jgi:hypothetical protein